MSRNRANKLLVHFRSGFPLTIFKMTRDTRQCLLMVGSHAVNSQSAHSKTEDACAKCTASASQTCKTNTVRKEAQRMTGQDSQKRFLLLATCRRSKLAIAFFLFCFATPTHSPLQMSLVLAGNRMSQKI